MVAVFMAVLGGRVAAEEVRRGSEPGSIVYSGKAYLDVVGSKDGFYRRLTSINGTPALFSGGRDLLYFSLKLSGGMLLVDCAYIESRNEYNGVRVSAGVCGLERPLDSEYNDIIYEYSDRWMGGVFSFGTDRVIKDKKPTSFLLGEIGGVSVYNRYSTVGDLESATPETYVKSDGGCYSFGKAEVFLIFMKGDELSPHYLDVRLSADPIELKRLKENDLMKLAVGKCM